MIADIINCNNRSDAPLSAPTKARVSATVLATKVAGPWFCIGKEVNLSDRSRRRYMLGFDVEVASYDSMSLINGDQISSFLIARNWLFSLDFLFPAACMCEMTTLRGCRLTTVFSPGFNRKYIIWLTHIISN